MCLQLVRINSIKLAHQPNHTRNILTLGDITIRVFLESLITTHPSHYLQILMSVSLIFMIVMRMLNVATSLDLTIVPALMDSLEMEILVLVWRKHNNISSFVKLLP